MLFLANISWKGASRFSGGEVGGSGVFQMGGFVGGVPKGEQGGGIGFDDGGFCPRKRVYVTFRLLIF